MKKQRIAKKKLSLALETVLEMTRPSGGQIKVPESAEFTCPSGGSLSTMTVAGWCPW